MRRLPGDVDLPPSGSRPVPPELTPAGWTAGGRAPGAPSPAGPPPAGPPPAGPPPAGPSQAEAAAAAAAVAAFALRVPPAELAALVWDGDLDPCPPPSWADLAPDARCCARVLCFARGDFAATVQAARSGPPCVRGQVAPAVRAGIQLQRLRREPVDLWADDAGRFWLGWVPAGPVRLLVRRPGQPCVATSWVLLG